MNTFDEGSRARPEAVEQPADAAGGPILLLATDGSEASWHASERAVLLAGILGAKLVVVHAIDVHGAFRGGIHYAQAVADLERDGRAATEKVAALARARGVVCEEILAADRPADAILGAAERFGADYVLMGVQGRSRAGQILLGSVSREVLLRAECTVLMVGGRRRPNDPMLDELESGDQGTADEHEARG